MEMSRRKLCELICFLALFAPLSAHAQRRISEDRDLTEIDLKAWDCLNRPEGTAKTQDGMERNRGKNRAPVDLTTQAPPNLDTAGFLKKMSEFEAATKGKRRNQVQGAQRTQLDALEKQVVSLTAYLVLAYAGPPESTNCGDVDFHDWHMELFEKPADHPPTIGDPTPIICEITPRTQTAIFRAGIRLLDLAGYIRHPDLTYEPTGHVARKIRLTGYLLWDDEHNGSADVGTTIEAVGTNGYHHPWRSTAWELHPVLKIEPLENAKNATPSPSPGAATTPSAEATPPVTPEPPPAPSTPPPPQTVTIVEAVKVKIPYGEATLPRGMKFEIVLQDAQSVTVRYMGTTVKIPRQSTDLRQPPSP